MNLAAIAKEHEQKQQARRKDLERKRVIAVEATNRFSLFVLDHLNEKVAEAFVNQKRIDAKIKHLNQNTSQFIKQSQQWIHLLENFNSTLKELGDVENWSRKIETDMKIINSTLTLCIKDEN